MTLLQCATRLRDRSRKQIYARAKDSRPFGSYIHDMGCLPFAAASFCFRPQLKLSQQRHFASVPPSRRLFARGTTQRHPPGRAAREKTSGNHKVGTGAKGARPHPTSARPQGAPSSPLAATTQDHRAGGHARKHPPEAVRPRGAGQRLGAERREAGLPAALHLGTRSCAPGRGGHGLQVTGTAGGGGDGRLRAALHLGTRSCAPGPAGATIRSLRSQVAPPAGPCACRCLGSPCA